jgi:hypothetical protein
MSMSCRYISAACARGLSVGISSPSVRAQRSTFRALSTQSAPSSSVIDVDRGKGGITVVTMSRPETLNAINLDTFHELAATAQTIRDDKDCRAVVLRGSGRAFCSGLDVKGVAKNIGEASKLLNRSEGEIANAAQAAAYAWRGELIVSEYDN